MLRILLCVETHFRAGAIARLLQLKSRTKLAVTGRFRGSAGFTRPARILLYHAPGLTTSSGPVMSTMRDASLRRLEGEREPDTAAILDGDAPASRSRALGGTRKMELSI